MKLPRSPLFLLLTLAVGCMPPEIELDDFKFNCAEDTDCPADFRCGVDGDCVPMAPSDPDPQDGGGDGDVTPDDGDGGDQPGDGETPDGIDPEPDPEPDVVDPDPTPDPDPDVTPDPDPDPDPANGPIACDGDADCDADQKCSSLGYCGDALDQCVGVIECLQSCEGERQEGDVEPGQGGDDGGDDGPDPCMLDCFSRAAGDAINPLIRTMACAMECESDPNDGGNPDDCFNSECEAELSECVGNEQIPLMCDEGVACMQYCLLIGDHGGGCFDRCENEMSREANEEENFSHIVDCVVSECDRYPGPIDRCIRERCDAQMNACIGDDGHHDECDDVCGMVDDACHGAIDHHECRDLCHHAQNLPDGARCLVDLADQGECDIKAYDRCRPGPLEMRPMMLFETGFHDREELDRHFDVIAGDWRHRDQMVIQEGGCPDCFEGYTMLRSREPIGIWGDVYRFGYTISLPSDGAGVADAFGAIQADCGDMGPQGCGGMNPLRRMYGFEHTRQGTTVFAGGEANFRTVQSPFSPAPDQRVRFEMSCRPGEAEWRVMAEFPHGWGTVDSGFAWNHAFCSAMGQANSGRLLLGARSGPTRFDDVFFEMPACWERERDLPFEEGEDSCGVVSYWSYNGRTSNNIYDNGPERAGDHQLAVDRHGQAEQAVRIEGERGFEYWRPWGMNSQKWTLEAWVRSDGPNGRDQYIVDDRSDGQTPGAAPAGRFLRMNRNGEFECGLGTSMGNENMANIAGPPAADRRWTYVACSFDGQQITLVNDQGQVIESLPNDPNRGMYEPNANGNVRVGESYRSVEAWSGSLDEVIIHEFAKSRDYMRRRAGM